MKLLEYEAKTILQKSNVPVPVSTLVGSREVPGTLPVILKSQVPIGGRGKAGGVVIVSSQDEYTKAVNTLNSLSIAGFLPTKLLAEELLKIESELYLSIIINKQAATIEFVAHVSGGVEVEENEHGSFLEITATKDYITIGEQLAEYFNLPSQTFALQELTKNLYSCFIQNDATLIEINPLVVTKEGKLVAGDCKMELDNAAGFRHPEWNFEYKAADANFVDLDANGRVATIANGAGLAMATVDAVADSGMVPANFLDIGGGANQASVSAAFEKISSYKNVSAIVINIFAGITRCDEVARAIIVAKNETKNLPKLYIRLAGTNYEAAAVLLHQAKIEILPDLQSCLDAVKRDMQ